MNSGRFMRELPLQEPYSQVAEEFRAAGNDQALEQVLKLLSA